MVAVKNVVIDKTVSVPDECEFVTGGLFRSTILFYYMKTLKLLIPVIPMTLQKGLGTVEKCRRGR